MNIDNVDSLVLDYPESLEIINLFNDDKERMNMNIDNVDFLVLEHSELLEIIELFTDDNEYNSAMISIFLGKPIKLIDWNTFQSFNFDINSMFKRKRHNYTFICISSTKVNHGGIYFDQEYSKSYFIQYVLNNVLSNKQPIQLLIEK